MEVLLEMGFHPLWRNTVYLETKYFFDTLFIRSVSNILRNYSMTSLNLTEQLKGTRGSHIFVAVLLTMLLSWISQT